MRKGFVVEQKDLVEIYDARVNGARRIKNVFESELAKIDKKLAALQKQRDALIREYEVADQVIEEYTKLRSKQMLKCVALKNSTYRKFLELKEKLAKIEKE